MEGEVEVLLCAYTKSFVGVKCSRLPVIFSVRSWWRASGTSAAASSPMAGVDWSWAGFNFIQISSGNAEAAADCRSGCDCLPTAWVLGQHKLSDPPQLRSPVPWSSMMHHCSVYCDIVGRNSWDIWWVIRPLHNVNLYKQMPNVPVKQGESISSHIAFKSIMMITAELDASDC